MKTLLILSPGLLTMAVPGQVHEHQVAINSSDSPQAIIAKGARVVPNKAQMIHHRSEYNGFKSVTVSIPRALAADGALFARLRVAFSL